MLNVLPNPQEADLVVKYAWIVRVENRIYVNLGAKERLQLKRNIEHTISKIKEIIFSYRSINDILFVNSFLKNFAKKMIISNEHVILFQKNFCRELLELIHEVGNYDVDVILNNTDVLDMFRDFIISDVEYTDSIGNLAAKLCVILDSCQTEEFILEYTVSFPNFPEGIKERCLTLRGSIETKRIELIDYKYVMSEAYKARAIKLGLKELVKEMIATPSEEEEN